MSRRVIKEIEAMVIGPEDRLLIRLPDDIGIDDEMLEAFRDALAEIGVGDRTLVVVGNAEFVKLTAD
jgi:hypothetical protein